MKTKELAELALKLAADAATRCSRLEGELQFLKQQFIKEHGANMAKFAQVEELRKQLDVATNAIADRLQNLQQQITDMKDNGATPEQLQTLSDGLQAEVDRLGSLASDPNNPVPADTGTGGDPGATPTPPAGGPA